MPLNSLLRQLNGKIQWKCWSRSLKTYYRTLLYLWRSLAKKIWKHLKWILLNTFAIWLTSQKHSSHQSIKSKIYSCISRNMQIMVRMNTWTISLSLLLIIWRSIKLRKQLMNKWIGGLKRHWCCLLEWLGTRYGSRRT